MQIRYGSSVKKNGAITLRSDSVSLKKQTKQNSILKYRNKTSAWLFIYLQIVVYIA